MKVALTGGATGIGAEVAAKLSSGGHSVTVFDRIEPSGGSAQFVPIDLGDAGSIDAAIDMADGPFDALINNAGLPPRDGLQELILQVNFIGLRRFLFGMLDRMSPGGAIVNTASRAGALWRENIDEVQALMHLNPDDLGAFVAERKIDHVRAYNLSKEAVIALTIAGTEDLIGRNLRMNSVSPSAVSTGILDDFLDAFGDRARKAVARAGRAGRADEIADLICFLAAPESHWIKGQDILIDGGISAMIQADALLSGIGLKPPA